MAIFPIALCTDLGSATTAPSVASPAVSVGYAQPQAYDSSLQTTIYVQGVFGTTTMATVQIEVSPDLVTTSDATSTWFALADGVFTAAGFVTVNLNCSKLRVVTTSGDSGTSITVRMM